MNSFPHVAHFGNLFPHANKAVPTLKVRSRQVSPEDGDRQRLKCERCGVEVDLPFRCNYCEHYYCPEHRLPENHECAETWRVKAVRYARASMSPVRLSSETRSILLPPRQLTVKFGRTESQHLIVGMVLVTAAGASFFLGSPLNALALIIATVLFSTGFILHELAHKYVAQGYGLWAEFRLNSMGVILTAMSIVSPIKFIAPGAVMISGFADRDRMGRTAFAGPLVNIVIAIGLLMILPALIGTGIYRAIVAGAAINSFLALFNLIPFAVLDGQKVYAWKRRYWAASFSLSLALTIYTYFILRPFI